MSLGASPGRFRHQNFDVLSLLPEHRMCPAGCHANDQTAASCPPRISAQGPVDSVCCCRDVVFVLLTSSPSFSSSSHPRPAIQYIIVPSNPPLVNNVSCLGCHERLVISFWCPRKLSNSFNVRMSNTFSCCPRHPLASQLPFWFHFKQPTWFLCA